MRTKPLADTIIKFMDNKSQKQPLVFVFSGQGPQNLMMARELYHGFPVFRESLKRSDAICKKSLGFSLIDDRGLFGSKVGVADTLESVDMIVLAIVFLQIALFDLLKSYQIKPDIVIGHSIGEVAVFYASGAISQEAACQIAIARGQAMKSIAAGRMLAVGAAMEVIQELMRDIPDIWISAINSPQSCTLSGRIEAIASMRERCDSREIFARELNVKQPYHCPLVKVAESKYLSLLNPIFAQLPPAVPKVRMISTVTGTWRDEVILPQYCWENVEKCVLFKAGVQTILNRYPDAVFLELAAHPVLAASLKECGVKYHIETMHRTKPEIACFLSALESLENSGFPVAYPMDKEEKTKAKKPSRKLEKMDIAIVGIGCRFPGQVNNKNDLWDLLLEKRDGISKVPADRWNAEAYYSKENIPGKIVSDQGGFIDEIDKFDYTEFNISPAEAKAMDPSQRILLETSHQALEDAGVDYRGTDTGVYIGGCTVDAVLLACENINYTTPYHITGIESALLANRLSYVFDLRGPSFAVDTACASSLTALNLAINDLWLGQCSQALVAGVQSLLHPFISAHFSRLGVISPTGRCHSFDKAADGYIRSEGCGAIVLKPLDAALRDKDLIYAVIKATGTGSNGNNKSITMPLDREQKNLIRKTLETADLLPKDIFYVEMHGTGTPVGDPIEVNSVGSVLKPGRDPQDIIRIGSIKSNLGHLEYAAGMASLIKVALMLKKKMLLPSIHFHDPNPDIQFEKFHMKVQVKEEPLPDDPVHVLINGYGFGGATACVIMSSPPVQNEPAAAEKRPYYFFSVGGLSKAGVLRMQQKWQAFSGDQAQASYILACRSRSQRWQSWAVAENLASAEWSAPQFYAQETKKPLAFLLPGDGVFYPFTGKELYQHFSAFRAVIDNYDAVLEQRFGLSYLKKGFFVPGKLPRPEDCDFLSTTICNLFFQAGMIELYKEFGIEADVVLGTSLGFFSGAVAYKEIPPEVFFKITLYYMESLRAKSDPGGLLQILSNPGAKNIYDDLALRRAKLLIESIPNLALAIDNDPTTVTVGGPTEGLQQLIKICDSQGIRTQLVNISSAVHVLYNLPPEKEIKDFVRPFFKATQPFVIPSISDVTGLIRHHPLGAEDFWQSLSSTSQLRTAIITLKKEFPGAVCIEISASPNISAPFVRCGLPAPITSVSQDHELQTFMSALGQLHLLGYPVKMDKLSGWGGAYPLLETAPVYSYDKKPCWWIETEPQKIKRMGTLTPPLDKPILYASKASLPSCIDHESDGDIIFPAVGYLEIGFESGASEIFDLSLKKAIILTDVVQEIQIKKQGLSFQVCSKNEVFAEGRLGHSSPQKVENLNPQVIQERCPIVLSHEEHYRLTKSMGFNYGLEFQCIQKVYKNNQEALAYCFANPKRNQLIIDLGTHDAVMQTGIHLAHFPAVPCHIHHIQLLERNWPARYWVYVVLKERTPLLNRMDAIVLDEQGKVLEILEGLETQRHYLSTPPMPTAFEIMWEDNEFTSLKLLPRRISSKQPDLIYEHGPQTEQKLIEFCQTVSPQDEKELWIIGDWTPEGAKAIGMGRSLMNEMPNWCVRLIQWGPGLSPAQQQETLKILLAIDPAKLEPEMRVARTGIQIPRLKIAASPPRDAWGDAYTLEIGTRGLISSLRYHAAVLPQLGPCDVCVQVRYSAINFKDVLIALGALEDFSANFGLEFSGEVTQTGPAVRRFKPGDPVMGFARDKGIADKVITSEDLLTALPILASGEPMELSEAASIPVVFVTTWYALVHQAKIKAGEQILIHSAAGGVGQAAIQICQLFGCEIFVTVHGKERQEFLRQTYGLKNFSDSHDVERWTTDVRSWSKEGVDVVLNALAGEHLIEGIKVLKSQGRFIEIGKQDFLAHRLLDMNTLFNNKTFFSVHIDFLTQQNQRIIKELFDELKTQLLNTSHYHSIVDKTFAINAVIPAFEYMQSGKHRGKIILSLAGKPDNLGQPKQLFYPGKTYLLIGGCGAIGPHIAAWMIQKGARHIILTGRRGQIAPEDQWLIPWAEKQQADISIWAVDAANEALMKQCLDKLTLPLGGIMLMSAVFDDKPFINLTQESFNKVYQAKVGPLKVVKNLFDFSSLDFCLLFSSIAATFGNPGQANYSAANAYLDQFAEEHPGMGVVSINIPGIMDVGQLKGAESVRQRMKALGLELCRSEHLFKLLENAVRYTATNRICLSGNWNVIKARLPSTIGLLGYLAQESEVESTDDDQSTLVLNQVAQILGLSPDAIDVDANLSLYGLDSLSAVAVSSILQKKFAINVTSLDLLQGTSINGLMSISVKNKALKTTSSLPLCLVPLNEVTAGKPIFFFHGADGQVSIYESLAQIIKRPCYGVKLVVDPSQLLSMEQLVEFYKRAIKIVQPQGPYTFVGWSAGGLIAWEIAYQLERNNELIDDLVVIDADLFVKDKLLPFYQALKDPNWREIWERELENLSPADKEIMDKTSQIFKKISAKEAAGEKVNQEKSLGGFAPEVVEWGKFNLHLYSSFTPQTLSNTQVTYFYASENQVKLQDMKIPSRLCVREEIHGDHWSIMKSEELYQKFSNRSKR